MTSDETTIDHENDDTDLSVQNPMQTSNGAHTNTDGHSNDQSTIISSQDAATAESGESIDGQPSLKDTRIIGSVPIESSSNSDREAWVQFIWLNKRNRSAGFGFGQLGRPAPGITDASWLLMPLFIVLICPTQLIFDRV